MPEQKIKFEKNHHDVSSPERKIQFLPLSAGQIGVRIIHSHLMFV
jgi:hypothetical protein